MKLTVLIVNVVDELSQDQLIVASIQVKIKVKSLI